MDALNDTNAVLSAILYFVDKEYRSSNPSILNGGKRLDVSEMLRIAMKNKLMYCLCKRILEDRPDLASKEVMAGVEQGEKSIATAKATVEFICSLFAEEGVDFLIIKTYKGLPYKTLDIDVLVRDEHFISATTALENRGAIKTNGRFLNMLTKLRLALPGYQVKDLLKIDLYKGILWWLPALDEEFMWKNPRLIDFYGVKCPIPSRESDLLSLLASSLFTDRKIALLDFLYLRSLLRKKPDYPALLEETKKHGWCDQFLGILSLIRGIEQSIYSGDTTPRRNKFPYTLPWRILNRSLPGVITNKISKNPTSFPSTIANVLFHCFIGQIYTGAIHMEKAKYISMSSAPDKSHTQQQATPHVSKTETKPQASST